MYHRFRAPDPRICQVCHGIGWYYHETPGRNRPVEAELKQCKRPHAEGALVENDRLPVAMFASNPQVAA